MPLAPQLLAFPSTMFLASQYMHKCHFQISFLQRKVSQPGKLKKSGTSFRPCSNATHQHGLCSMKDGICLSFAFNQILTSWGKGFCWYKPHHPILLGPVKPPPHLLQLHPSMTLQKLKNQSWTIHNADVLYFFLRLLSPSCAQEKAEIPFFLFFFCWLFTLRGHAEQ